MTLCIGPTGSGKTNALMDFIARTNGEFYKIIINSFSTTDEPLYNHLRDKSDKIEFYDDINEMPELIEFEDFKDKPKLMVIDDFINLTNKKKDIQLFNQW